MVYTRLASDAGERVVMLIPRKGAFMAVMRIAVLTKGVGGLPQLPGSQSQSIQRRHLGATSWR